MKLFCLILVAFSVEVIASDYTCVLDDTCDYTKMHQVSEQLGWNEVLESYEGMHFNTIEVSSTSRGSTFVSSMSNGSLTALLLLRRQNGLVELLSAMNVANHAELQRCNIDDDDNEDICLTAIPTGTNVERYEAKFVQTQNSLVSCTQVNGENNYFSGEIKLSSQMTESGEVKYKTLLLSQKQCFLPDGVLFDKVRIETELQLVANEGITLQTGENYWLSGEVYHAHTAHHFTNVLIHVVEARQH